MPAAPDVALVTAATMPKADLDTPLLVAALTARGVAVEVRAWDAAHDWAVCPLVVVRTPWDYCADQARFVAWAQAVGAATRLVNPADVIAWNADKAYLADLGSKGAPLLPTVFVTAGAGAAPQGEALAAFDGDVVVKPAISSGARGVLLAPAASGAAADHLAALVATEDVLVQAYEPTVSSVGEDSLVFVGGVYSHAVRKVPAAGDFRVQDQYGGTAQPYEPTYLQEQVAAAVLAAVPATLSYARVDLVRPEEPAVMELEVVEPDLFLRLDPPSVDRFADHLLSLLP